MSRLDYENRPLAMPGLTSYRYKGRYDGWIMIGARSDNDALHEAGRSTDLRPLTLDRLQVWKDGRYTPVGAPHA